MSVKLASAAPKSVFELVGQLAMADRPELAEILARFIMAFPDNGSS